MLDISKEYFFCLEHSTSVRFNWVQWRWNNCSNESNEIILRLPGVPATNINEIFPAMVLTLDGNSENVVRALKR